LSSLREAVDLLSDLFAQKMKGQDPSTMIVHQLVSASLDRLPHLAEIHQHEDELQKHEAKRQGQNDDGEKADRFCIAGTRRLLATFTFPHRHAKPRPEILQMFFLFRETGNVRLTGGCFPEELESPGNACGKGRKRPFSCISHHTTTAESSKGHRLESPKL
jgi:hypothetical protein